MIQAVILASDETHLTNFSGSKVFHALYMTLGNIHGPIRRQPQSGAWLLLAILPSCSFTKTLLNLTSPQSHIILNKTEAASLPGILKQCLYHESMAIVIAPLCPAQRRSHLVQGPGNKVHSSMPCLLGYIADMKEQFMIACVTPKACPVCLAQPRLDDSTIQDHSTAKLCTGNSTLSVLHRVRKAHPNVPIWKFRTLVSKEKCGVSGYVEHPFWEGLDVGPSLFIYQDLLHGAHKFFWDHPCKWIASLIGTQCLDRRISLLPKEGLHHFKSGISKLKQASGREHRDLLKYIAPALAGAPGVTSPFRDLILALLHIIMIIQLPMLDDDILGELDKHFEVMYANADEVISLGLRSNLWIPKLMALTHFRQDIQLGGVSSNWSSETPETLHKLLPKSLYGQTNHKDYHIPMLEMLTVHETKRVRHQYNQWRSSIQTSQLDLSNTPGLPDHGTQDYGIKIAQRPHKQGVAITSLTSAQAGLISAICNLNFNVNAQDAPATSTSSSTYDLLSSPRFPRKYNKLDLWWSYRLTIPPFNEFYEKETRTIWSKGVEDYQKSKWKGSGSCVFVLVHPKRLGIHSMSATTLKGLNDITK